MDKSRLNLRSLRSSQFGFALVLCALWGASRSAPAGAADFAEAEAESFSDFAISGENAPRLNRIQDLVTPSGQDSLLIVRARLGDQGQLPGKRLFGILNAIEDAPSALAKNKELLTSGDPEALLFYQAYQWTQIKGADEESRLVASAKNFATQTEAFAKNFAAEIDAKKKERLEVLSIAGAYLGAEFPFFRSSKFSEKTVEAVLKSVLSPALERIAKKGDLVQYNNRVHAFADALEDAKYRVLADEWRKKAK